MSQKPSPDAMRLRQEVESTIEAYRAYLASPAFQHSVDLMVLVKIAGDERADIRERRRAAEVLAKLRLQAMEGLADLTGVREQALDALGLKAGPQTLALTQVNQQIEIVRAKDWRSARAIEDGEVVEAEVLPSGHPSTNGHAAHGEAKQEDADASDPAA